MPSSLKTKTPIGSDNWPFAIGDSNVAGEENDPARVGVLGDNAGVPALGFLAGKDPKFGQSAGVFGVSGQQGVIGLGATGVFGGSDAGFGVRGETQTGVAVQGESMGVGLAAKFLGNVEHTGDIKHLGNVHVTGDVSLINADLAEDFLIVSPEPLEPGTVAVVDVNDTEGRLRPCDRAYDRRVAGVIAGGGGLRPGVILGREADRVGRQPVALVGRVFCNVDADYAAVAMGDLLTTSPTLGHAMKAVDRDAALGSIIGKALRPLGEGRGLIPILVALQ